MSADNLPRVVNIARCPEHGLHGCRTECFVCGGPVEQVPMVPVRGSDDDLTRPLTASWPDVQQWWDVIRAALAEDYEDSHYCRRMLRQEGVELAYGDAEAVAALRDVWAERDALARRIDAARALCDEILAQPPEAGRTWMAQEVRRLLVGEAGE